MIVLTPNDDEHTIVIVICRDECLLLQYLPLALHLPVQVLS